MYAPTGESEAETFFREYIDAEYQAILSKYSEPDGPFRAKVARAFELYPPGGSPPSNLNRAPVTADKNWDEYAPNRAQLKPRLLFKLKKWQHPEHGDLYGAYMGSNAAGRAYHTLFLARPIDGKLRIVAELGVCLDCATADPDCGRCGGGGWERVTGLRLDPKQLGWPEWSRKLLAPKGPERADYETE